MKFSDIVQSDAIVTPMKAATRDEAIRELVDALRDANAFSAEAAEDVYAAAIRREEIGTTGIGRGVAVPHAKTPGVSRTVCAIGISEEGVDFSSLDCEKVKLFFALVSPSDCQREHLAALEYMSRFFRDEEFCQALKSARNATEVHAVLEQADSRPEEEE